MLPPTLPSILPSQPAVPDVETTREQMEAAERLGKVTMASETAIYICGACEGEAVCYRLYPTLERVMQHRRREHGREDGEGIVTWN